MVVVAVAGIPAAAVHMLHYVMHVHAKHEAFWCCLLFFMLLGVTPLHGAKQFC
jgi:hypothetical protein